MTSEQDIKAARQAIIDGWNACKLHNNFDFTRRPCDCDLGAIDGCKARVEALATAIAAARSIFIPSTVRNDG